MKPIFGMNKLIGRVAINFYMIHMLSICFESYGHMFASLKLYRESLLMVAPTSLAKATSLYISGQDG